MRRGGWFERVRSGSSFALGFRISPSLENILVASSCLLLTCLRSKPRRINVADGSRAGCRGSPSWDAVK